MTRGADPLCPSLKYTFAVHRRAPTPVVKNAAMQTFAVPVHCKNKNHRHHFFQTFRFLNFFYKSNSRRTIR